MLTDIQAAALSALLHERLGATLAQLTADRGELTATIAAADIGVVGQILRDAPDLSFRLLVDLSGVDYQTYGQADWSTHEASSAGFSRGVSAAPATSPEAAMPGRFAVVYHLLSTVHNRRLRLKVWLAEDPPRLPSVTEIWPCADWYEREAFDLFGILFEGHPDLRRLLTDYGFIGHPFRKDFPLEGYVEVRYDAEKQRVVYQPVSIESRVLVPRVIRSDVNKGH
jgi:NADH-quinone oxidoreductase subunit C